mmetsp:Transcript_13301/g.56204  ORF Transcript_13301/g.56204 Transcript_13301/m.56204 type:complete len:297 (-) Transcript_13301:1420-2310(-)
MGRGPSVHGAIGAEPGGGAGVAGVRGRVRVRDEDGGARPGERPRRLRRFDAGDGGVRVLRGYPKAPIEPESVLRRVGRQFLLRFQRPSQQDLGAAHRIGRQEEQYRGREGRNRQRVRSGVRGRLVAERAALVEEHQRLVVKLRKLVVKLRKLLLGDRWNRRVVVFVVRAVGAAAEQSGDGGGRLPTRVHGAQRTAEGIGERRLERVIVRLGIVVVRLEELVQRRIAGRVAERAVVQRLVHRAGDGWVQRVRQPVRAGRLPVRAEWSRRPVRAVRRCDASGGFVRLQGVRVRVLEAE